jgi:hypothetical protein
VIGRWRRRRAYDLRQRLVQDVVRTQGLMVAMIADARRVGAEVPDGVTASVTVWRSWTERLEEWAEGDARGTEAHPT